jgi:ATP-binding cassette subfamily B protein
MTLGEFVAFNGYLGMMTWPLMAVGYVANQYQRGTAALSRVCEVLDASPSPRYQAMASHTVAALTQGSVEFRDLTFAYSSDHTPVLRNISLKIPTGKICVSWGNGFRQEHAGQFIAEASNRPTARFYRWHRHQAIACFAVDGAVGFVS